MPTWEHNWTQQEFTSQELADYWFAECEKTSIGLVKLVTKRCDLDEAMYKPWYYEKKTTSRNEGYQLGREWSQSKFFIQRLRLHFKISFRRRLNLQHKKKKYIWDTFQVYTIKRIILSSVLGLDAEGKQIRELHMRKFGYRKTTVIHHVHARVTAVPIFSSPAD